MATFYLDYEGGNDSNDGTTFANRWKTFTNGATAARIAPGDTIRVMGSPDPTSLGVSATWTNKSTTVTLSSALNVLITNCDTAWTASTNVTATADTSYFRGLLGDKSAKLSIAAGFTTGKVAYFGLGGAQNYSSYQGVTLWLMVSAALAASTLEIKLCSDTTGDTPVDTMTLPAVPWGSQWVPVHLDKGSALGNSIQSIAVYAALDPGTIDVYLDNISTTKAAGNDCLTLNTLIGKNTTNEAWWAIQSINGTTIKLDYTPGLAYYASGYAPRGYSGVTESVTTYIRKTIATALEQYSFLVTAEIMDSGTAGNLITFSGGWDRTAMTTQSLEGTWFDGQSGNATGLLAASKTYLSIDKLNFCRYTNGLFISGGGTITVGTVYAAAMTSVGCRLDTGCSDVTVSTVITAQCQTGLNTYGMRLYVATLRALSGGDAANPAYGSFINNQSQDLRIDTLIANNHSQDGVNAQPSIQGPGIYYGNVTTNDNFRYGFVVDHNGFVVTVDALTANGNTQHGLYLGFGTSLFKSVTTSGNGSGAIMTGPTGGISDWHTILKSSLAETTKLYTGWGTSVPYKGGIRFHEFNNTANDHRLYIGPGANGQIFSETSVRHTASGLAWKISLFSATIFTQMFPYRHPIARLAVKANQTLTVSVWLRRTNTGINCSLVCPGGQLAGVPVTVSSAMTAAQDTWEKVSLVLGPTADGVLEFELHTYGGSTYSVYYDDFSAAQV